MIKQLRWALVSFAVGGLACGGASLTGCGKGGGAPPAAISAAHESANAAAPQAPAAVLPAAATTTAAAVPSPDRFPVVVIKTSLGDMKVRLNAAAAPLTVDNFVENYVKRGFYAGTIFHHVEPGFIAAGGFTGDLQQKPTRAPIRNESHNGLKNRRGTIAMARSAEYSDSATSQFFINLVDEPAWDFDEAAGNDGYCVFGEVIEGLDVADRIAAVSVTSADGFPKLPQTHVVIETIERVRK